MPDYRFLVVRHFGGPHERKGTCAEIKRLIENRGLSHVLPLIKYEPGGGRGRGEYYLGVAVDESANINGESGEDLARQLLVDACVRTASNRHDYPLIMFEAGHKFLPSTLECENLTTSISYERPDDVPAPSADELISEIDANSSSTYASKSDGTETKNYDYLLQWCSSIGGGGVERIKYACRLLGISDEWGGVWSILRRLVLLGHAEFDDSGNRIRWGMIPPVLVKTADGKRQFLAGQRTPRLLDEIGEKHDLETRTQVGAPSCLLIEADTGDIQRRSGRYVVAAGNMSDWLACRLPALENWAKRLPEWSERDFSRYEVERYDSGSDRFLRTEPAIASALDGFCRFTANQGQRRIVVSAYRINVRGKWYCGDYYGLRYLARSRQGICRVRFKVDKRQLIMPSADRWPMPYERALVLASGRLPKYARSKNGLDLVYEDVTPKLAETMMGRLGLEMEGVQ